MAEKNNTQNKLREIICADLFRYTGKTGVIVFLKQFFKTPGFRYTAVMRWTFWLKTKGVLFSPLYVFCRLWLRKLEYKFGISIPYNTCIQKGLYIGHFGGIIVSPKCRIGINCNLNHGVTIGETFGGKYPGVPVIGDSVYIGPHSLIIGGIAIGDNAAIGAGSVVTRPVAAHCVVAGNPAKMISDKGSDDYMGNRITRRRFSDD